MKGKKQQVTKILKKRTVALKCDKNQRISDDDYSFSEELHDTIRYLDFIAMECEPENYITPEEYNKVINRKKKLERIASGKGDENKNRSFSYLDEWLQLRSSGKTWQYIVVKNILSLNFIHFIDYNNHDTNCSRYCMIYSDSNIFNKFYLTSEFLNKEEKNHLLFSNEIPVLLNDRYQDAVCKSLKVQQEAVH